MSSHSDHVDLERIARALERIATALEKSNQTHVVNITETNAGVRYERR